MGLLDLQQKQSRVRGKWHVLPVLPENSEEIVLYTSKKLCCRSTRPGTCRIRPRARGENTSERPIGEALVSQANEAAKDEEGLICSKAANLFEKGNTRG
jgi:hypothetical protein